MKGNNVDNPFKKHAGEERRGIWGTAQERGRTKEGFCFREKLQPSCRQKARGKRGDEEIQQGDRTLGLWTSC